MSKETRERFISLLNEGRMDQLAGEIAQKKGRLRHLNRLLYETGGLLRWRAIEGMGAVAHRMAGEDPEAVRNILRNLLWTINEESGGIGWRTGAQSRCTKTGY